jgi:carboxylesterase type B
MVPIWARRLLGWDDYELLGSEDCLFLDVNVPKKVFDGRSKKKGAPVLVWIYGGGYTAGSKWQFGSGAGLLAAAEEPIIYVALNYRVRDPQRQDFVQYKS